MLLIVLNCEISTIITHELKIYIKTKGVNNRLEGFYRKIDFREGI